MKSIFPDVEPIKVDFSSSSKVVLLLTFTWIIPFYLSKDELKLVQNVLQMMLINNFGIPEVWIYFCISLLFRYIPIDYQMIEKWVGNADCLLGLSSIPKLKNEVKERVLYN